MKRYLRLSVLFIFAAALAQATIVKAANATTDHYVVAYDDPIFFDSHGRKDERLQVIPVSLDSKGEIDESSFLYQVLRLLRYSPGLIGLKVTIANPAGPTTRWIKISRPAQISTAYNFLRGAGTTFHYEGKKFVNDSKISDASLIYLSEFFPLAALKVRTIEREARSSGIEQLIERQSGSTAMLKRFDYALSRLQNLSAFVEGFGQLVDQGALDEPSVKEQFMKRANTMFADTAYAFSSVISNKALKEVLSPEDTQEYVEKLGALFNSAVVKTNSSSTNQIVSEIVNSRYSESERLTRLNTFAVPKDMGRFQRVMRDSLILFGGLGLTQIHHPASFGAGVFSLAVWNFTQYRQRQASRQEHRLIDTMKTCEGELTQL